VVRLEVEASASPELVQLLVGQLDLTSDDVFAIDGPIDLRVLMGLVELPGFDELRDPAFQPVNFLSGAQSDLFAVLDERDVLLHHPYDSYDPVIAFLAQAGPRRLPSSNALSNERGLALIAAFSAPNGTSGHRDRRADGAVRRGRKTSIGPGPGRGRRHVIYGSAATGCQDAWSSSDGPGLRRYVHLGTGNYNERTARGYTDFGLMTTSPAIAEDASAFFSSLTGYSDPPRLKKLVMAPTGLRQRFLKLIDRETASGCQPARGNHREDEFAHRP
jgi:polyphosphate kinase